MTTQFRGIGSNRPLTTPLARLSRALLAAVIIAASAPVAAGDVARSAPGCPAPEPVAGQFTGKFVDGAPVYRLASMTVWASRAAELPDADRQARLTRAGQVRTRSAARPPA
jgi:hypothetical protein